MRFRTGVIVGGVIGYVLARELAKRDTSEPRPVSVKAAMERHPSAHRFADQGRRLAERAGWKGLEAVQRARATIHRRLEPDVDDLSMN